MEPQREIDGGDRLDPGEMARSIPFPTRGGRACLSGR